MNFSMLLAILICLSLAWLTGFLLQIIFRFSASEDFALDSFVKLTIGLVTIITIYAIIVTGFNTILIGLVLLSILFLIRNRKREKAKVGFKNYFKKRCFSSLLIALLFGFLFFLLQGHFFYNTPFNNLPHGDYTGYYSKIIDFLNYGGIESRSEALYLIIDGRDCPSPYHYSEFWLASLFNRFFDVLSVESYTVAVHSVLGTVLAIGMLSLSRLFVKSVILQVFAVLFIFVSGISFYDILPQTSSYLFGIGWNPKVIVVSIFFIWFSVLLYKKNKFFYYPLLFLPIVNIGLAPAILTSLVIFAVYYLIFKKSVFCNVKNIIVDSIITGLFILVFYYINSGNSASGDFNPDNILTGLAIDKLKPIKIIVGTIFIVIYIYILYLIPIILVIFSKYRVQFFGEIKTISFHIVFFLLFSGFGLLYWSLVHPIHDSIQFFYMVSILYINILFFIFYAKIFNLLSKNKTKYYYIFNIIVILLITYNLCTLTKTPFYKFTKTVEIYSEDYLYSLKSELYKRNKEDVQFIAFISCEENLNNYWSALSTNSGDISIPMIISGYYPINLNAFNTPLSNFDEISRLRIESSIKHSAFYKFAEKQKIEIENPEQIAKLQYEFINLHNIKYLLLDNNTQLPNVFKADVDTILFDNVSGKSFVFLKQ